MDGVYNPPGFTRRPNQKPIEALAYGYLRLITSGARLRQERKYLQKAEAIINMILNSPCCSDPTAVVDLITPYDNQLTIALKDLLTNNPIVRRSFRLALERILNTINTYLRGCCFLSIVDFSGNVITNDNALAVFDVNNALIGVLDDGWTSSQFVTLWNTSTANNAIGTLTTDSNGDLILEYLPNIPHIPFLRGQNLFIYL
jgi:hypothetical protein